MELNYKKLYTLDLKSIFNFDSDISKSDNDLNLYLMEIAEGLKRDIENINNKINNIKTVKTKLDFLYGHIYHVEDLKLQFTKKIEMKKELLNIKNI